MKGVRGPVNLGAALFLLALCSVPGWLSAAGRLFEPAFTSDCGLEFGLGCEALVTTHPLVVLPCVIPLFSVVLLFVYLRPPTRDDIFQEPERWSWSMAWLPHGISMAWLAWFGLAVTFAANETVPTRHTWAEEADGRCDPREARRVSGSAVGARNVVYGGMILGGLFLVAGTFAGWRRTREFVLDEVGVQVDGERFAFKDLEPAVLTGQALLLRRYSGEELSIPVFGSERALAQEIVDRIQAARPEDAQDRASDRDKLGKL